MFMEIITALISAIFVLISLGYVMINARLKAIESNFKIINQLNITVALHEKDILYLKEKYNNNK